jgi:hypothetical protein
MDKLKALLLPLAFVFATSELQLPLGFFVQGDAVMDEKSKQNLALIIDHAIATGSLHRKIWYLDKKAKAALDKVLTYALSVRGDGTEKRFEMMENAVDSPNFNKEKLVEIQTAVREAKTELMDNAPSVEAKEATQSSAAE